MRPIVLREGHPSWRSHGSRSKVASQIAKGLVAKIRRRADLVETLKQLSGPQHAANAFRVFTGPAFGRGKEKPSPENRGESHGSGEDPWRGRPSRFPWSLRIVRRGVELYNRHTRK